MEETRVLEYKAWWIRERVLITARRPRLVSQSPEALGWARSVDAKTWARPGGDREVRREMRS